MDICQRPRHCYCRPRLEQHWCDTKSIYVHHVNSAQNVSNRLLFDAKTATATFCMNNQKAKLNKVTLDRSWSNMHYEIKYVAHSM